ncbi:S1C family serine protease [Exiguobacterium acetylicum]
MAGKTKALLPGLTGGIIGAVLTATVAFPILLDQEQQVADTPLSNGMPKQVSTTTSDPVTNAVATAQKSVVTVTNYQAGNSMSQQEAAAGSGSGVIYKKENGKAYIITNHHVVDGASKLDVTLNDGKTLSAKLLGSDETYDLAVLEVDASDVPGVITLGKSADLKAGQTVLAIGNPLGEFQNSVTRGIVSSKDRTVPVDTNSDGQDDFNTTVIQTDAAINPGNSGGALINEQGQLVGINSMKIAESGVEGVGFSIPIDDALPILKQLETNGKVEHPTLGVSLQDVAAFPAGYLKDQVKLPDSQKTGVVVMSVEPNSPAAAAKLKTGDVITKINDSDIKGFVDIKTALIKSDGPLSLTIIRDGKQMTVETKTTTTDQL